jgi:hypothetical protein
MAFTISSLYSFPEARSPTACNTFENVSRTELEWRNSPFISQRVQQTTWSRQNKMDKNDCPLSDPPQSHQHTAERRTSIVNMATKNAAITEKWTQESNYWLNVPPTYVLQYGQARAPSEMN